MKKTNQKKTLFGIVLTFMLGIAYFLTTKTVIFAVINCFQAQSKHEIKIKTQFARLEVKESQNQDKTAIKTIIPLPFPILDTDNDSHYIAHIFDAKLHSNGSHINKKLYLKTDLKYSTKDGQSETFPLAIAQELFNSQIKINGSINNENNRTLISPDKVYPVIVETEMEDYLPENIKKPKLFVIVDYEIVDENGKTLEGTKGIIQKQVQTQSNS